MIGPGASRRRGRATLLLVGMVLLMGYPLLLVASTRAGLALGLRRDVTAERDLVRALSYAADRSGQVTYRADSGQLSVPPIDPRALVAELEGLPGYVPGVAAGPDQGAGGPTVATVTPTPTAVRPVPGTGGTAAPGVTPTSPSGPSQPPSNPCPNAATGGGHLAMYVSSANGGGGLAGATVRVFFQGCLFASDTTNSAGHATGIHTLGTATYTYVVSHAGYMDARGSFPASATGSTRVDVKMTPG